MLLVAEVLAEVYPSVVLLAILVSFLLWVGQVSLLTVSWCGLCAVEWDVK